MQVNFYTSMLCCLRCVMALACLLLACSGILHVLLSISLTSWITVFLWSLGSAAKYKGTENVYGNYMLKKVQSNLYRLKHCDLSQTGTQMRAFEKTDGRNRAFNQEWTLTCSSSQQAVQNQHVSYLRLRQLLKSGTWNTVTRPHRACFEQT